MLRVVRNSHAEELTIKLTPDEKKQLQDEMGRELHAEGTVGGTGRVRKEMFVSAKSGKWGREVVKEGRRKRKGCSQR